MTKEGLTKYFKENNEQHIGYVLASLQFGSRKIHLSLNLVHNTRIHCQICVGCGPYDFFKAIHKNTVDPTIEMYLGMFLMGEVIKTSLH